MTRATLIQRAQLIDAMTGAHRWAERYDQSSRAFSLTDRGVRRYGFHGLSYEYIASVLPELDPRLAQARVIVAHLGNGASLCALRLRMGRHKRWRRSMARRIRRSVCRRTAI